MAWGQHTPRRTERTPVPQYRTFDKGHGRIETRTIWLSSDLDGYLDFPHAHVVFRIERTRTRLDGISPQMETVYGVTSHHGTSETAAERLLRLNRGHWKEESLPWVRDTTYDEDRSQVRKGNGPRTMATLRHTAIGILRLAEEASVTKATRWCANMAARAARLVGLRV